MKAKPPASVRFGPLRKVQNSTLVDKKKSKSILDPTQPA